VAKTYTWNGGTAAADDPTQWTPTGVPGPGDTAIVPSGDVQLALDTALKGNTVEVGSATLGFIGDQLLNFGTPTVDQNTLISNDVGSVVTTVLDSAGTFVNQGSILANGTVGSAFTINIAANGTIPGYLTNYGEILVNSGNSMTIAIGADAELFNVGEILVNGGSLDIATNASAIAGGLAPEIGAVVIGFGGTVETNAAYGTAVAGTLPNYVFTDTSGNTLKIDNIGSFGGRILGFGSGDTIDLGTSLAVTTALYDSTSGILNLENTGGTVLASLAFGSGNFGTGSAFAIGTGADGDTVLTTAVQNFVWNNTSGNWQTAGDWFNGAAPGSTDTAFIGLHASAPFTVTTGSATVDIGALALLSDAATLQITSSTTAAPYATALFGGMLEVTSGNTFTGSAILQNGGSLLLDPTAVLDLTGHVTFQNSGAANNGTIVSNGTVGPYAIRQGGGSLLVNGATINAGPGQGGGNNGGEIAVGYLGGGTPASVTVQSGSGHAGSVTDTYSLLSSDPTSFGSLTLTGTGTTWTDAGDPADTNTTRGYMLVGNNAASPNTPAAPFAGAAQLLVENGASLTEATYARIGNSADSAGNATITSGAIWTIGSSVTGGFLNVGNAGSGTLTVSAGATVDVKSGTGTFSSNGTTFTGLGIGVANDAGSSGAITVDGSTSLLETLDSMGVGRVGQGELIIQNSGSVAIGNGGTNGIGVGNSGQGTLLIQSGGKLSADGLGIAQDVGGTGTVTVTGSGSTLTVRDNGIGVGKVGTGLLMVEAGGVVSSGTTGIGIANNTIGVTSAVGTIVVDGPGSSVSTTGGMGIGREGQGTLEVRNSGSVDLLTTASNLNLGGFGSIATGTAHVSVSTGGQIEVEHNLVVWQGSTVSVLDGTSGIDVGTSLAAQSGDILVEASHLLYGDGVVSAAVQNGGILAATNDGTFSASTGGTLDITGTITGSGTAELAAGTTLKLDGGLGSLQTVQFNSGSAETLILGLPGSDLTNHLNDVSIGDRIELSGLSITGVNMLGGTAQVLFSGGTYDITNISFVGGAGQFVADPASGSDFIEAVAPCFVKGTRISTERGEIVVQDLRVGDRVQRVLGGLAAPVIWIGRRVVNCTRHPQPRNVWPVRVSSHAFGLRRPCCDLYLSPDHAIYVDDVLIPVKHLINGTSIAQVEVDEVIYYHVELPQHSVLIAENLPAESYLDTGDRSNFINGGGAVALYADFASRVWDARACAPLVVTGPELEAARRWVNAVAPDHLSYRNALARSA
jgi:T5SS/PEP-CTERM-associated repeat protein